MAIRLIIVLLATLASFVQYAQRYNMSIAIIAMVNHTAYNVPASNKSYIESGCPGGNLNQSRNLPEGTLNWDPSDQGMILSAYFYGYTATQIIGGRFSELWGGKIVCGIGVLFASLATMLIPTFAENFLLVFLLRVIVGCFHGVIYASLYSVFNKWVPDNERSTAVACLWAGGNLGAAVALPLVSYICTMDYLGGWRFSFYAVAALGCIWYVPWLLFVSDSPEKHPRMSENELKIIEASIKRHPKANNQKSVPWMKMISSTAVLASIVAKTTGFFSFYVLTTQLPLYMENILNVPIKENGFFNSALYLVMIISLCASGRIADLLKSKNVVSTTLLRKVFQAIAMIGLITLALVPFAGCDQRYVIACIILSIFVYGFLAGGELPIVAEFAPNYSATVFGISNFFGSVAGIVAPVFVGWLLDENIHDKERWNIVFNTCAAVSTFGLIFFSIFATAKPQSWD